MDFTPTPVRRLRQQIEEQLLAGIVSGTLTEGDKLPSESQLAEMFSVARSTIREALGGLAQAGLVEKVPGAYGGSFVRKPDARRFGGHVAGLMDILVKTGAATRDDVTAVRAMLEVPACRLAAARRTSEDLALLNEIIQEARGRKTDAADIAELDMEFHGAIAAASENPLLNALVRALHAATHPAATLALTRNSGSQAFRQHEAILTAITDQDPDAAEKAICLHLDYLATVELKQNTATPELRE